MFEKHTINADIEVNRISFQAAWKYYLAIGASAIVLVLLSHAPWVLASFIAAGWLSTIAYLEWSKRITQKVKDDVVQILIDDGVDDETIEKIKNL